MEQLREQLRSLLSQLSGRQKILISAVAAAVIAGIAWFAIYQRDRDYAVLYSGLAAEDASTVVNRLKESTTPYKLSEDGTTIRIRKAQIPGIRLDMAAEGIPKTGRIGFELFDRNNFGITEFTEQVNYHRALEGEMERTLMTIGEVEQARVHITPAKDSVFVDQRRPAKGSVLVRLKPGGELSKQNIRAIAHLVSSGVDNLGPESVSVLDVHGNLLTKPLRPDGSEEEENINRALLSYRREVEQDLLAKVNQTLEPLLGAARFRAAVSVDCDLSTSEQSEESYDPERNVITTSQKSEDTGGSVRPSGVPGAPSNLPRPTSRPGQGEQLFTRKSENLAYQPSRLIRRTRMPQGNIRRVSVSVLMDHTVRFEGEGAARQRIVEPASPERLKATRDIVTGVVGFNAERGDLVVVESLPFESTLAWQPPPQPAVRGVKGEPGSAPGAAPAVGVPLLDRVKEGIRTRDKMVLGTLGGIALALLMLGGAGIWVLRKRRRRTVTQRPGQAAETAPEVESAEASAAIAAASDALVEQFEKQHAGHMAARTKEEEEQDREILQALAMNKKLPTSSKRKAEVLSKYMGQQAKKTPDALVQVVRTWMSDNDA